MWMKIEREVSVSGSSPEAGNGDRRESVQLLDLDLLAAGRAAMHLGAAPIASIQHRAQIGVRLLCLGIAENTIDLIVKYCRPVPWR